MSSTLLVFVIVGLVMFIGWFWRSTQTQMEVRKRTFAKRTAINPKTTPDYSAGDGKRKPTFGRRQ